jgi:hypothetical protein
MNTVRRCGVGSTPCTTKLIPRRGDAALGRPLSNKEGVAPSSRLQKGLARPVEHSSSSEIDALSEHGVIALGGRMRSGIAGPVEPLWSIYLRCRLGALVIRDPAAPPDSPDGASMKHYGARDRLSWCGSRAAFSAGRG